MARIFISYRREDSELAVSRLVDDLSKHFPRDQVFQDIASIDPGANFRDTLNKALGSAAVMLAVIGPGWLSAADKKGRRRLDLPGDFVRLEVAESLRRPDVRVFPILVNGADMPAEEELPDPLKELHLRQAFELTVRHWHNDVAQLVQILKRVPGLAESRGEGKAKSPEIAEQATLPIDADPSPGTVFRDGDDCPEMVVIPVGEFVMGSPDSEPGRTAAEEPQHRVRIACPFALGRYALTVAEFGRFVAANGYKTEAEQNPSEGIRVWDGSKWVWSKGKSWRDPGFAQAENHPVVGVSWNDALAYTKWLSEKTGKAYRLPGEAEWEYAARARTTTRYPWGDEPGNNCANFFNSGSQWSGKQTAPVGSFDPNKFGLYDMIGNVWERLQDCWNDSYKGAPTDGSAWESGNCGLRVVRGGSWTSLPEFARVAYRGSDLPTGRYFNRGFRLARTL